MRTQGDHLSKIICIFVALKSVLVMLLPNILILFKKYVNNLLFLAFNVVILMMYGAWVLF